MPENIYTRAVAFTLRDDSADADGLTLEGYAAVFNSPTLINDWDGEYEETISPGAFKHTIRNNPGVKLQFDHGQHPVLGSMPIGAIQTLSEDAHGLHVRARLIDNWMTEPLRQAIEVGAVDGMSFRFQVVKDIWDRDASPQQRTIKEIRLFELGPVVFPAYRDTTASLRSLAAHVPGVVFTVLDSEGGVTAEQFRQRYLNSPSSTVTFDSPSSTVTFDSPSTSTTTFANQVVTAAPTPGTSEEPAVEARGSSDEAATPAPDPAPRQSVPSTKAEREQVARRLDLARQKRRKDLT